MKKKIKLTYKQTLAKDILEDHTNGISELVFGGAAGGAKSFLGCRNILKNALKFHGSRWLIGRSKLKTLKETTLVTFHDVAKMYGVTHLYKENAQNSTITFYNGSVIVLKDLFQYPSDKNFDSLGSLEITGAFIDECNQLVAKAWNVVKSRIRYKLEAYCWKCGTTTDIQEQTRFKDELDPDDFNEWYCEKCEHVHSGLMPKLIGTCNPAKNWVYSDFYNADRTDKIKKHRHFIAALPRDNPNLSRHYLKSLLEMDSASVQRLYYGNWDFDDDPATLCNFRNIQSMYTNAYVGEYAGAGTYITADIATKGSDKFVVGVWYGFALIDFVTMDKSDGKAIVDTITKLSIKYNVPNYRICFDADGVGSFLDGGYLMGAVAFHNGGKPIKAPIDGDSDIRVKENYRNLKSQCYFKLAALINSNKIYIECDLGDYKEELNEELAIVKNHSHGTDDALRVTPKKEITEQIGRSPDWSDMLAMRLYFALVTELSEPADIHFYSNYLNVRE